MNPIALHKLSYGLYVLTTTVDETPYGCIINTAFQITAKPARIAISCNKENYTHDKIAKSQVFGLTVLSENTDSSLIATFGYKSGKEVDKFSGLSFTNGQHTGVPLLHQSGMATLECKVVKTMEVGSHTVFVGEVIDATVIDKDAREMTYQYYHEVLKGSAPKNAPTYSAPSEEKQSGEQWKCSVCGYVHDNASDTNFEDLPDDWTCPVCGVGKELFEKM